MKLNRELQRRFLVEMTECFPNRVSNDFLTAIAAEYDEDEIDGNLMYLEMHGLITLTVSRYLGGNGRDVMVKFPTEKAFDFLAEDGGLSAVLNVVTVKLHADTVRDLLAAKIAASDVSESEKQTLLQKIRELPAEALSHLSTRLLDYAVDQIPDIARWLGKSVGL